MRTILMVLGVVLLGTAVASANGLGAFGSYWDSENADSGWGGGAKMQMEVLPNICLEARGTYFPDFGDSSDDDNEIKIDIIPVEADAIIKFPIADQFKPYAGGGVGYYIFEEDSDIEGVDVSVDDEFGGFALAGLEINLGKQVAVFVEANYRWVEVTVEARIDGVREEDDVSLNGFGGNAGLMLIW